MGQERKITEIFGKCYRLMHRLGVAMGDRFFADLWSRESDGLLSDFIVFLKVKGETLAQVAAQKISSNTQEEAAVASSSEKIVYSKDFVRHDFANWQDLIAQCSVLQHQDVVKHPEIVQHVIHVAQSRALKSRIRKILELREVIKHVGQTDATTPLLLERELLKLWLTILDSTSLPEQLKNQKDGRARQAFAKQNLGGSAAPPSPNNAQLSTVHKEILNFIKSRGDQIQNTEIFARFGNIHRRTLKRKLRDLVLAGSLTRSAKGKKVHYSIRAAS